MEGKAKNGFFQLGGKPGPGRKVGNRNKLGEKFLEAVHDDFLAYGEETIERMRETDPVSYIKMIASLLPKEVSVSKSALAELTDDEVDALLEHVRHQRSGSGRGDRSGPGSGEETAH